MHARMMAMGLLGMASALCIAGGCGDDGPGTSSITSVTGSSSAAGGASGTSGQGAGSTTGNSQGSGGGSYDTVNGCNPDTADDETGSDTFEIGFGFVNEVFLYDPKCVMISAGTTVTFKGINNTSFQIHPLKAGKTGGDDPSSPISFQNSGDLNEISFVFDKFGTFPYHCVAHKNMKGAIYVK
jgi:plastocyanin